MVKMITALMTLGLLLVGLPAMAELSAREIMQQVDDRDDGDNGISDLTMTLIDKNGATRIRSIRTFMRDVGEDRQRIMFFLTPADVKDTAFLTYDYDEYQRDDDQWLYLPALRKTKRIASSDKSGSFMGSDFNYADMTRKNLDAYDFTILKELKVGEDDCWLIEALPKTREEMEETGYKKSWVFVRKDNFMVIRAVHWNLDGNRVKYLDTHRIEQIDGIWVASHTSMTTKEGKHTLHKTELVFDNIRFNQALEDEVFSVRRLEQGL